MNVNKAILLKENFTQIHYYSSYNSLQRLLNSQSCKCKRKVRPRTGHEGSEGELRYTSHL